MVQTDRDAAVSAIVGELLKRAKTKGYKQTTPKEIAELLTPTESALMLGLGLTGDELSAEAVRRGAVHLESDTAPRGVIMDITNVKEATDV